MPRQPRRDLAGVPQHIVQRGNDRHACFFEDVDYRTYLTGLREASLRYGCALHAYVLMTNHVHFLLTPNARGGVSRVMQWLGRHYVGYINGRYRRTGTLWEGRYKSCLVDTGRYLLYLLPIHRAQSRACGHGSYARRVSLVELSRQRVWRGRCVDQPSLGVRATWA